MGEGKGPDERNETGIGEGGGSSKQGHTERGEIAVLMEIKIAPRQIFARNDLRNSEV